MLLLYAAAFLWQGELRNIEHFRTKKLFNVYSPAYNHVRRLPEKRKRTKSIYMGFCFEKPCPV